MTAAAYSEEKSLNFALGQGKYFSRYSLEANE